MATADRIKRIKCKKCGTEIERIVLTKKIGEKWWCKKCKKNVKEAFWITHR
jgi:predicted RNA-binding Zn-ribbon protein involved in translation (DUF1610 family)